MPSGDRADGFESLAVCSCQPVGCDGELYSTLTVDRCGVCGGNGTSCQRISGSYRKALAQLGNTHTNTHQKKDLFAIIGNITTVED